MDPWRLLRALRDWDPKGHTLVAFGVPKATDFELSRGENGREWLTQLERTRPKRDSGVSATGWSVGLSRGSTAACSLPSCATRPV